MFIYIGRGQHPKTAISSSCLLLLPLLVRRARQSSTSCRDSKARTTAARSPAACTLGQVPSLKQTRTWVRGGRGGRGTVRSATGTGHDQEKKRKSDIAVTASRRVHTNRVRPGRGGSQRGAAWACAAEAVAHQVACCHATHTLTVMRGKKLGHRKGIKVLEYARSFTPSGSVLRNSQDPSTPSTSAQATGWRPGPRFSSVIDTCHSQGLVQKWENQSICRGHFFDWSAA